MAVPEKSVAKPTIHLLRGDDELAIQQYIEEIKHSLGDAAMVEMNTTRLDGTSYREEDLSSAAFAMPFLAEKRLVILTHPLSRLTNKDLQDRFLKLLERIPETTLLLLVLKDTWRYKRSKSGGWEVDWGILKPNHWLIKWSQTSGGRALLVDLKLPQQKNMAEWIQKKAREMGGQFKPAAAETLAEMVGTDTSQAVQEIEKLLTYVNFQAAVETVDVKKLTASGLQSNVFDLLDAVSDGNPAVAVKNLEGLLEQSDPANLFYLLVRQFRLLLQAREILDEGGSVSNIQAELNQPSFVAEKIQRQARRFNMAELEDIYHKLLTLDEEMKTSQITPLLGIQLLVAEVSAK